MKVASTGADRSSAPEGSKISRRLEGRSSIAVMHLGRNGGGPKFTFELARALRAAGHPILSVVSNAADNRGAFVALGPTLALPTFATSTGALVRSPLIVVNALRLRRQLRRADARVLVVAMEQIWQAPLLLLIRSRRWRVLICVHDATMHPGEFNTLEQILRSAQRAQADQAIVFSEHVGRALVSSGSFSSDRVTTSVHGAYGSVVPLPRAAPSPDEVPVIGFFGRLAAYKGLGLCQRAVALVRARGHRVRFRVVGNGDDPALASLTHPDDELLIGWVADDEIAEVLAGFTVLALSYVESSQSGVLAYALSNGLPMVATPVGGLQEQASATGAALLAADMTAEAFADALQAVLQNSVTYVRLSERALISARSDHSWERVAADVSGAVDQLVHGTGPR